LPRSRSAWLVVLACSIGLQLMPVAAQDAKPAAPKKAVPQKAKKPPARPAAKSKPKAKPQPKAQPKSPSKAQPPKAQTKPVPKPPADMGPKASTDTESVITKPGDYRFAIPHAGAQRTYRVHVPLSYDRANPAPLVVAMHRGDANMDEFANDAYYGLLSKSEREGFIVVFPNGPAARAQQADDVGFVRQVVANVFRQLSIERDRIYATGLGRGGAMVYRLACEAPGLFKAIAVVGGADNSGDCSAEHPVAVLHIHAKDDPRVPIAAARSSVAKWAQLDGCTATPRRILDQAGVSCEVYSYCQRKVEVQLCVTDSGGSSWPGSKPPSADVRPSTALSATQLVWEFFSRY
jgi:polyhydroxybutyrate depolymerase